MGFFEHMKNNSVNLLSIEECKKLPTPRLLAYYKKHRHLRHFGCCECCRNFIRR